MSAHLAAVPPLARPESVPGVRIDDVIVGERARKDYGDLAGLVESIRQVGLLQPIGLAPGNRLLFGGRRLEACRRLGWESIPVTRPETREDALSLLKAERDENTCRKAMTPEELVDLGLRIEELERPKAEERQREGRRRGGEVFAGRQASDPTGHQALDPEARKTSAVVGEALGLSRNTYQRMKTVVTTARDDTADPDVRAEAKAALADLNEGKSSPTAAYHRVRKAAGPKSPVLAIPQPPRMGGNRRKHAQVLQAMTTSLTGIAGAADEITELDNSVTKEEAAQLVRDLSRSIRSLNQIKKLLEERTR